MTKTISSRIPKELHDRLKERCGNEGCNTNDFIRDILENELEQEPNEGSKPKEPQKISVDGPVNDDTIVRKPTIGATKTTNDGTKYKLENIQDNGAEIWTEIEEPKIPTLTLIPQPILKKIPEPATMRYINGQWRPYATRYEV